MGIGSGDRDEVSESRWHVGLSKGIVPQDSDRAVGIEEGRDRTTGAHANDVGDRGRYGGGIISCRYECGVVVAGNHPRSAMRGVPQTIGNSDRINTPIGLLDIGEVEGAAGDFGYGDAVP